MREPSKNLSQSARVRRGRAVLVGYGLDDAQGHVRYTRGGSFELYGGSRQIHEEMQRRARRIEDELDKLGISLDNMTYEQYLTVRDVVNRLNHE
ncbi:MAG: hypothetical protein LIP77_03960 [Planctomycetes bacterium]|nr:hypothetical protein [Planctomycetota bacterium]